MRTPITDPSGLKTELEAFPVRKKGHGMKTNKTTAKSPRFSSGPEWVDSWTTEGGWTWYTPEDYNFRAGRYVTFVVYYLPGDYWNLVRYDAFYFCGETDWRNYIASSTTDFSTLPPPPPGYGWITGVDYKMPSIAGRFDRASRLDLEGYSLPCGVPLSGRPDCFEIYIP